MKIEDYCAKKAYDVYEENFLRSNKDNLSDIEKLNFQKQNNFIRDFTRDLRKNLAIFLNRFPEEDRDAVRKSLTQILKNNFDNLQENNIIDVSGEINVEAITVNLNEGVKNDLPEIYQKTQEAQQIKTQSEAQNEIANSLKENVDFSNPEETKKYFDNFYKNFTNCKTREEKLKHIENGFGISLEDMSEQQQDTIISAFGMRQKIREIKENLRAEFQEANLDLSDENLEPLLENRAVEQYSMENNKDFEKEKSNNDMMVQLENISMELQKLEQKLSNCKDQNKIKELSNESTKLINKQNLLIKILALSKDEVEKIAEDSIEQNKNTKISESEQSTNELEENESNDDLSDLFATDENELDNDLSDLLDPNINEAEEDLSDLFTAEDIPAIEENPNNEQPTNADKPAFVNPILNNVKEDDLKQEDYIVQIDEKEGLWSKLKNGFSKMKNAIIKKLGLNKVKFLNRQRYLDTAENNTKTTDIYFENKCSFNESLIVSEEEQKMYKKEYEVSKSASQKNTSHIHTNHEQNIQF